MSVSESDNLDECQSCEGTVSTFDMCSCAECYHLFCRTCWTEGDGCPTCKTARRAHIEYRRVEQEQQAIEHRRLELQLTGGRADEHDNFVIAVIVMERALDRLTQAVLDITRAYAERNA